MKLTVREKVMLFILAAVMVAAAYYYLLLKPQLEQIGKLALERESTRQMVEAVKNEGALIDKLRTDYEALYGKIAEEIRPFYPEILQDRLIVLLDGVVRDSGVYSGSQGFSDIKIGPLAVQQPAPETPYPLKDLVGQFQASEEPQGTVRRAGRAKLRERTGPSRAAPRGQAEPSSRSKPSSHSRHRRHSRPNRHSSRSSRLNRP